MRSRVGNNSLSVSVARARALSLSPSLSNTLCIYLYRSLPLPPPHPSLFSLLSLSQFDMAIVELHGSSTAKPAQLYDGGDLGISDCKKMTLSYLSWADDMTAEMTKVQLTDHKDCQVSFTPTVGLFSHYYSRSLLLLQR